MTNVKKLASSTSSSTNETNSTIPKAVQLSTDSDFSFEILRDLAVAPFGGSDIEEVLIAAGSIRPGDFNSFYNAFNSLANRVHSAAKKIDLHRFPVSARETYFRASTYFRSADFYLHGNPSDPRINSLWAQQQSAFNIALSLMPIPGKRITLKADGFDVPAIWYAAAAAGERPKRQRPTIIIGGGYDGGQEELYHQMVASALQRGWNAITYEGPGQATPRRTQNLGFILEWEKVVSPIVDYLHTIPSVDKSAIALVGLSFGGFLAPRAAAFEHRLAAVMALDGLYEFGPLFLQRFPQPLIRIFETGNQTAFDDAVNKVRADPGTSTSLRWIIDQGTWAFNTPSPFDWMTQLQRYTLKDVVGLIKGPIFVGDAQDDMFFEGQGKVLADKLGDRTTYHEFMRVDGAGEHAGIGSSIVQNQVVFDWLQNVIINE